MSVTPRMASCCSVEFATGASTATAYDNLDHYSPSVTARLGWCSINETFLYTLRLKFKLTALTVVRSWLSWFPFRASSLLRPCQVTEYVSPKSDRVLMGYLDAVVVVVSLASAYNALPLEIVEPHSCKVTLEGVNGTVVYDSRGIFAFFCPLYFYSLRKQHTPFRGAEGRAT